MKVFSLLAAVLVSLAASAETKDIVWDSSTIQSISLGKSVVRDGDTALIVYAKDDIYLKMESRRNTQTDFYGRGIYTDGWVFFTPSKGKLTRVVINASQENAADGWTTQGNQLVWTGDSAYAYISSGQGSVSIQGIQDISFTVEASTDTISPTSDVEVSETNFPDANFRNWIKSQYYGSDGVLTAEEIASVKTMNIYDKYIESLQGIEFFTALTALECQRNQLTSLDVSKNAALTTLSAFDNQLTSLNVNGCAALTVLSCSGNRLSSLSVAGCTALTNLTCYSNQIKGELCTPTGAALLKHFVNHFGTMPPIKMSAIAKIDRAFSAIVIIPPKHKCMAFNYLLQSTLQCMQLIYLESTSSRYGRKE